MINLPTTTPATDLTEGTDTLLTPAAARRRNAYVLPVILITSLFFLWGMANNLNDILIRQFKKAFRLSDFQSGLVQSAFYLGYFLLALPAAFVMRRYSYKTAIIAGLVLYGAGALLFVPAANIQSYNLFLFALFVIASGLAFLETVANPYVASLGSPETAGFRVNLAQAFNPVGCITGIVIGQQLIFSGVEHSDATLASMSHAAREAYYATETAAVKMPYAIIGLVVLLFAVLIGITRFPVVKDEATHADPKAGNALLRLFRTPHLRNAVIAQFCYVGAQVGIWSFLIRYVQATAQVTEKAAANCLILSLIVFTAGRFAGTALLKKFQANRLLATYALINILLVGIVILFPGKAGLYALVASSFFMSIMYPTIFTLGLEGLGSDTKQGASLIVMSIIGGAVLTALMGKISDHFDIHRAFLVPVAGFAVVAWYGLRGYRRQSAAAQ
jgi:FHS family L-fucose permease-like MFS transporter